MSDAVMVRSFTDLRSFAADAPEGGLVAGGRRLPMADGPVGIVAVRPRGGGRAMLPADLFVLVLAGALAIGGRVLGTGASIVLPAGCAVDWTAEDDTLIVTMACVGAAGADAPVAIDLDAVLEPSGAPLAELLVGPTPRCRNHTDYRSASGEFLCGTWDSTPYHRRPMRYRHHELMQLLDGAVTFADETGRRATFAAGDVFVVEQGASCSWDSRVDVKKVYAIYRPA
ncbi:MAG: cupin domain-containing protein [Sphingomonas fennica]